MILRLTLLSAVLSVLTCAQEYRALISGQVTDSSGAAVPGAGITAVNTATSVKITTTSALDGQYVLAQVPLGTYTLTCEAQGFKRYVRSGITLNVGDRSTVNIRLEVGAQVETVTVTADIAPIDTDRSVLSQLMDNKGVSELPLNGRQVYMLAQLSAGTIFTVTSFGASGFSGTRAWDVNGSLTMHGGPQGTNQFNIDGASINAGTGDWKFAPLVDGIQEFKVNSPANDASLGLSGGGVVNMTMKSGSNEFHGTLSEYVRNDKFDAVSTQSKQASIQAKQHQWNDFSALVSGPVIRNRLFFSSWYEGYRERVPFPTTQTVPTALERAGNFSDTRNASGQLVVIYDPFSTVASGSGYARTAIPGNIIPDSAQSTISKNILNYIPLPNVSGNAYTHVNNYISAPNVGRYGYDAWYSKFDYSWNQAHRTSASVSQNWGTEFRASNGIQGPANVGNDPLNRTNFGSTLDHVWSADPTTVVNVRLAWQRYNNFCEQRAVDNFDGSVLGWTNRIGSYPKNRFPSISFSNAYVSIANTNYGSNRVVWPDQSYSVGGSVSKMAGKHFLRMGTLISETRPNRFSSGAMYGSFTFSGGFTQRDPLRSDTTSGNAMAGFLLGVPSGGGTDTNGSSAGSRRTYGLYLQDDFKVTTRLTLNLGLRWDLQTPIVERYNRAVVGFDPNATYVLGSATAKGGLIHASPDNRTSWKAKYTGFQPRIGMAYQMNRRLVMRGSYGLSYLPTGAGFGGVTTFQQTGFSRNTPYNATIGGGVNAYIPNMPGASTWVNPYPSGILQPYGNSLGPRTGVGTSITYISPDYEVPYGHQFSFGFGYELPWEQIVLEASYVGNRTRRLGTTKNMNAISLADRLQCFANQMFCLSSVTNPFAGASELVGTSLFNPTIQNGQALLPYPQFTGVSRSNMSIGYQNADLLEVRVTKKYTLGLMFNFSYTLGKMIESRGFREPQYTTVYRTIAGIDRTHHIALTFQYDFPFGNGKRWLGNARGTLNHLVGGWQYNTSLEFMTGTPTTRPDAFNLRDPRLPSGQQSYSRWFNTCTLLANGTRANCASADEPIVWVQMTNSYQLRTYDDRFPNLRNPGVTNLNMSVFKNFRIRERVTFQFRAEAFNAFNTPQYGGPNTTLTATDFGRITISQQNFPRSMQFAFRLQF